ncbi:hypothetical protein J4218_03705 [Candidatus Pacearchaeota archaeon]|nr:hypothetical protein [Candidatus Pacearchaeota archaeon]
MNGLIIPGFHARFPNDTYLRKVSINANGQTSATQIIQLDKYCVPTREELLELIRTAAEESIGDGKVHSLRKYITKLIPNLEERTRIAQMDNVLVDRIRLSIPYSYQDLGKSYLRICHGIVPNREIEEFDGQEIFPGVFAWLIGEKSYNRWATLTRLEDDLFLPTDSEIQFAFDNRIFNSSLLMVDCDRNPFLYPEIEKMSRRVYVALRLGNIEDLEDVSDWFAEKLARKTIRFYVQDGDVFSMFDYKGNDTGDCDKGTNVHGIVDYKNPFSRN